MSQSSLDQNQSQNQGQPRSFLKKGEGLKRFHAYKPPLPSANKMKRRQTFVKFKLDEKPAKGPISYPLPETVDPFKVPEFPKKPKTERTPIRPKRQALGTLKASTFNIESTDDLNETSGLDFKSNNDPSTEPTSGIDIIIPTSNNDLLTISTSPADRELSTPSIANDLSTPSAGIGILALGKQIEQLQVTVDDLKEQLKKCHCGLGQHSPKRIVTRASARRAQKAKDDNRPSANADNSTPKIVKNLSGDVARLKEMFDEMNLLR